MSVVHVSASKPYDIYINEYRLDEVGRLCATMPRVDKAFIVSDSNVAPLYLDRVGESVRSSGLAWDSFVFPAGERSKTLETYGRLLVAMAEAGCTRDSLVVALGGGVTGDIAGFAASTYMRGCACIQVPTSLLACVDSSVGGKTAVDLPLGKNLVGAFFQPDAVVIDTSVLATLEPHFFTDGCAEVIKYGVIADAGLFDMIQQPLSVQDPRLEQVICRCVQIKRDVVEADEQERGLRQTLNFGHTLGHSIESLSHFGVTHGFAVGCGMALMARACQRLGICDPSDASRLIGVLASYGFDVEASWPPEQLYSAALQDKKRHGSVMNVVAMEGIGKVRIDALPLEQFKQLVERSV